MEDRQNNAPSHEKARSLAKRLEFGPAPFIVGLVVALVFGWWIFPELLFSRQDQPVQFSHETHLKDASLDCSVCHHLRADGTFDALPSTKDCAVCHSQMLGKSEAEQVFFNEYVKKGKEVDWKVYQKQPDNVFFSHAVHSLATCNNCHEFSERELCSTCHLDMASSKKPPVFRENRISGYSQNTMKTPMLDRRGFLKFIGGAAVGTLATPVVWKGLDDISIWSQNWPWIPSLQYGNHENTYVRTVSKLCPAAGATKIRLVGGRPVRVLSDPESPLGGGVSALAVTEVQMRYSPARLKRPLLRNSDGGYREITWEEAEKLLLEKLAAAKKQTEHDSVVCISGDENGTMNELLAGFAAQTGSGRFFAMPSDAQATAQAWKLMGGRGRVGFDIPNSDYVFAVGANVLETWGSVVVNRHAWGQARPAGAEPAMRLAYAGPVQNNTAAGADLWLPIKPGVARQLIKDGVAAPAGGLDDFAALVAKWTPEKVCEITGLMPERFTAVVDGLKKAKKPLVVVGSDMDQGGGTGPVRIGMAINMLLDRVNKEGGMRMIPLAPPAVNGAASYDVLMQGDLVRYAADMAQGNMPEVGVLMVYEANPVYALPGKDIEAVFKKSDFSVAFTCFFDETARRCDLVLPNALGLERYDDVAEPFSYGKFVYALVRPVAEPLYQARPAGDVVIDMAYKLGINLGVSDVVTMLKAKAFNIGADWGSLSDGNVYVSDIVVPNKTLAYRFSPDDLALVEKAEAAAASSGKELAVAFVSKLGLGTPETAIPPFNTKLITDDELDKNMLVAAVNGATLKKLGLYEGNRIVLTSKAGKVMAKIRVFEGVTNDTVALTMGFGHTAFGEFNDGKGMDVMALVTPSSEPGSGLSVWNDTRVNVAQA